MVFDLTTIYHAREWLKNNLGLSFKELLSEYTNCSDTDSFVEKHYESLNDLDMNLQQFAAFHVTTNSNQCNEIRTTGICNLQRVLGNSSELSRFLYDHGFNFDIEQRKMMHNGKVYDINYNNYKSKDNLSFIEEKLRSIARKICSDFQVTSFLFSRNIFSYGTNIDERPEFLQTLSSFCSPVDFLGDSWRNQRTGYVIKYLSMFHQFSYNTFYNTMEEYLHDSQSNWIILKKWMLSHAFDCCFSNLYSDIYAYMKPSCVIKPEQITEYISIDKWKENNKNDSEY